MGAFTIEQIEQLYQKLLERFRSGQLAFDAFVAEVYKLQAQDDTGNWWMIDPLRGSFLRYDGTQWVADNPPKKAKALTDAEEPPSSAHYILWYRVGQEAWSSFELKGETIIGRQSDCDLPIPDARVSRKHAKLEPKADGVWLSDLGSHNGTFLEGQRLQPHQPQKLQPEQTFVIANVVFRLAIAEAEQPHHEEAKPVEKPVASPGPQPRVTPVYALWYRHGTESWHSVLLDRDLIIGRKHDCDLQLPEETVSRQHARLSLKENDIWLTDLGSSNGTWLAGERLLPQTPSKILPGQEFTIGDTVFRVALSGEPMPDTDAHRERMPDVPLKQDVSPPVAHLPPPPERQKVRSTSGLAVALLGSSLLICFCAVVVIAGVLFFKPAKPASGTQAAISGSVTVTPPLKPVQRTPSPTVTPEVVPNQTWLVILYQDAEDKPLEIGSFLDMNEAELVGGSDRVRVITQFDRFKGGLEEDGAWTSARRLQISKDSNVERIQSAEIGDEGEVDMADPNSLVEYVTWAIETYPADRYVLILSDHGMGWVGALADDTPTENNYMKLRDIEQALSYTLQKTGIAQFDLIGFDACLMGQMEVFYTLAPFARYIVASEETEPMLGWAYEGILKQLVNHPDMEVAELAQAVVNSYIEQDITVTNDYIRNEIFEGASAQDVAYEKGKNSTLSAVDTSRIAEVNESLERFIAVLQNADQATVAWARTNAQHYEDAFMEDDTPLHNSSTIDLAHFALLMKEKADDPELSAAADQLISAVKKAVVSEKHGPQSPGSHGISIFFPLSEIYVATYDDTYHYCYTCIANTFAENSSWPAFLKYHYSQ